MGGDKMKKNAVRFKMEVNKRKALLMAEAEKTGQGLSHGHEFQRVQDATRSSMMQVGRLGSAGEQFLVSKGLTQADILIAVVGSIFVLCLLIIFIFAGVKAFTEPGSEEAASVNSGLIVAVSKATDI